MRDCYVTRKRYRESSSRDSHRVYLWKSLCDHPLIERVTDTRPLKDATPEVHPLTPPEVQSALSARAPSNPSQEHCFRYNHPHTRHKAFDSQRKQSSSGKTLAVRFLCTMSLSRTFLLGWFVMLWACFRTVSAQEKYVVTVPQCKVFLAVSDTDRNVLLSAQEYLSWLDRVSGSNTYTTAATFEALPLPLQQLYTTHATSNGQIDLAGARPGTFTSSPSQGDNLEKMCNAASAAFDAVAAGGSNTNPVATQFPVQTQLPVQTQPPLATQ